MGFFLSSMLVLLMAMGLRLRYFSGLGLGDDLLLRNDILTIVHNGHVNFGPNGYRFTWWIPTVLTCRLFGLGEAGFITPIAVFDALGIVLVGVFARRLWGSRAGVIAALLLAVLPLDVAWSTMLASDVILSFCLALCMYFVVRAPTEDDRERRRRCCALAAVGLWLAFHAKVSAVMLVPVVAIIGWANRRALGRDALRFVWTAALLFGASALVFYVLHGNPLAPFDAELRSQGLTGREAQFHQLTAEIFKVYPRWLFLPDAFGTLVYSVYPHVLIVLAIVGALLGIRPCWPVFWWLCVLFLGMELNVQHAGGYWIVGFRNVRHGHVFTYPLVLLLTGYLTAFRARWPKAISGLVVLLLGVSLWQSIGTAMITHVAFGDLRNTTRFLATLPPKPTYSDFQVGSWFVFSGLADAGWHAQTLEENPDQRRQRLTTTTSGYLVTGGAREPYYGCIHCIPRAADVPTDRWSLIKEFPDPIPATFWRPEPLRIWEARPAADGGAPQ